MRPGARLWGFYLPLALAGLLAVWFVVGQLPRAPSRTRLMVLVVTSSQELPRQGAVWKEASAHDGQRYAELLSAANIPFEMMWMERFEIPLRYLVEGGLRKYAAIILATSPRNLSDRSVEALLLASKRYGVSLLAAGDAVDGRLRLAFGLDELRPEAAPERRLRALTWARARGGADGTPLRVVNRFGRAVNYYFAATGRGFLDGYGPAQREVREALTANGGYGMVWASLAGAAVLRMDDALFNGSSFQQDPRWPGGLFVRIDEAAWDRVRAILARHGARMSVGVVTGYVDDGDEVRGTLYRRGQVVTRRRCGEVYDSREMVYVDRQGPRPGRRYDYESEYRGLSKGVREGILDPEVHGWSHVSPDRAGWCRAPDRYANLDWLMELAPQQGRPTTAEDQQRILTEGTRRIVAWFGVPPSALIPPAHGVNEETDVVAREFGLRLLNGVFLSLLRPERVIQNGKIKTFWAHWQADGLTDAPLKAGYPFVVGLHDRELVRRGPEWFDGFLERWRALGVRRFITLRELAAHLGARLAASLDGDALTVVVEPARVTVAAVEGGTATLDVPLTLRVRLPAGRRVTTVEVDGVRWREYAIEGEELELTLPRPGNRERQSVRLTLAG